MKKLLSYLIICCVLLSVFLLAASCDGSGDGNTDTNPPAVTTSPVQNTGDVTEPSVEVTTEQVPEVTEAPETTVSDPDGGLWSPEMPE